jgi:hypothetical protein
MPIEDDSTGLQQGGLMAALFSQLPEHLRAPLTSLSDQPPTSRHDLLSELDRYSSLIDREANRRGDLDVQLADELLRAHKALLESEWPQLTEDERHLVVVSCRYYLHAVEAAGDLDSVFGFEDDAVVLNLTLDLIAKPALKILL